MPVTPFPSTNQRLWPRSLNAFCGIRRPTRSIPASRPETLGTRRDSRKEQRMYASDVDVEKYGEYRINRDDRPLYRFANRITSDGSSGFPAEPGRYHVYAGWFCPWSQRVTIEIELNGLRDAISVSYVDGERDGRGWAFRERNGPDSVNGFTLLREAYEVTEPGFDGHISVPTLWDRVTGRVVSNDFVGIGIDVATQFRQWSNGVDTYPKALQNEIETLV